MERLLTNGPLDILTNILLVWNRGMRGRSVPPLVKKIVFGGLAKILFIQLDVAEGCSCTKAKVRTDVLYGPNDKRPSK